MYDHLLIYHSYLRWLVIASLLFQLIWLYIQMKKNAILTRRTYRWLLFLVSVFNIQFLLGWWLYLESPLVTAFWNGIPQTVKTRSLRFFGIEHMTMMTVSVLLINGLMLKAKARIGSACYGWLWQGYLIVALMLLSSVPWSFSPFTARPNWR